MRIILMAIATVAFATSSFAQDAAELVCAEYAAMDNAGQMAMIAEIDTMASGDGTKTMTAPEISTLLAAECTANPDKLVVDIVKEAKKL